MDLDDLTAAGAGAGGGLVRWLRSPDGRRGLALALTSSLIFGFGARAVVRHYWPDLPADLLLLVAALAGILSATILELLFVLANLVKAKCVQEATTKLGPSPVGVPHGPDTAASGGRVTPPVVVADGVHPQPVPAVVGGERLPAVAADGPAQPAG